MASGSAKRGPPKTRSRLETQATHEVVRRSGRGLELGCNGLRGFGVPALFYGVRTTPSFLAILAPSLALGASLAACAPKAKVAPGAVVEGFYAQLLSLPIYGAPDSAQVARIAPVFSDSLVAEFRAARRLADSAATAHPDEKPPFADGDLFTSLFEGPTSFFVMGTQDGPPTRVLVHFEHREGNSSVEWVDTVYVARRDTSWVITDVAYGGTWPMAARGRLTGRLRE